ncbi:MAG: cytochrome c maturation protein CcmE [Bacteroidetes bacterium]|nr:cytochrome c maturation protein CcmE [Bacteroidota bacterium]
MRKPRTIISLVALVGFSSLLLLNFGNQVSGYMHFSEAEASGASAHVVGIWVQPETAHYSPEDNLFVFHMQDEQGTVRKVHYSNPKPASFESAEKLVVEGTLQGDIFMAEHILMKCPSKYSDSNALGQSLPS